jgi:hypothetical protein
MDYCKQCGKPLSRDEIGLHKKLVNRGATEYWCISCLGAHFGVSILLLEQKIAQFKADGCTLFK